MEYTRVRQSVTSRVSKGNNLEPIRDRRGIIANLKVREVGVGGKLNEQVNTSPIAPRVRKKRISDGDIVNSNKPLAVAHSTNLSALSAEKQEDMLRRARQRMEHKKLLKEKFERDQQILKEQEEEEERQKQLQRSRVMEQERRIRDVEFREWKEMMRRKQDREKREEAEKEAQKKQLLDLALRERQEKYFRDLKDGSAFKKSNGNQTKSNSEHSEDRYASQPDKLQEMLDRYEIQGKIKVPSPTGKAKKKKKAKPGKSDEEIQAYARRIVEEANRANEEAEEYYSPSTNMYSSPVGSPVRSPVGSPIASPTAPKTYVDQPTEAQAVAASISDEIEAWYRQQLANVSL